MANLILSLAVYTVLLGTAYLINTIKVQFGMRTLMIAMTLFALAFGVIGYAIRH